jgi:hypothetical protein
VGHKRLDAYELLRGTAEKCQYSSWWIFVPVLFETNSQKSTLYFLQLEKFYSYSYVPVMQFRQLHIPFITKLRGL